MRRAIAYLRVSTDRQETSIEEQRAEIARWAELNGFQVVKWFADEGYTGTNFDRPAFQSMLNRCGQDSSFTHVVMWSTSRFGRAGMKQDAWAEVEIERTGKTLIYVSEGELHGLDGDTQAMVRGVKSIGDRLYVKTLSADVKRAMVQRAAEGWFTGGPAPFGYDRELFNENGKSQGKLKPGQHKPKGKDYKGWHVRLRVNKKQARIIGLIFQSYASGETITAVVNKLNERHIPSPRSKHWTKGQVSTMLRSPIYRGQLVYNRTRRPKIGDKGKPLKRLEEEWVTAKAPGLAIVDEKVWEVVQARLRKRSQAGGRRPIGKAKHTPYLLSGLMVCQNCGSRWQGHRERRRGGKVYHCYVCGGYHNSGLSVCSSDKVSQAKVEGFVLAHIHEMLDSPKWKEMVKEQLTTELEKRLAPDSDEEAALREALKRKEREIGNLIEVVKRGVALDRQVAEALKKAQAERDEIQEQVAQLERVRSDRPKLRKVWKDTQELIDRFTEILAEPGSDRMNYLRKLAVRQFVKLIEVFPKSHFPKSKSTHVTVHFVQLPSALIEAIGGKERAALETEFPSRLVAGEGFEPPTRGL